MFFLFLPRGDVAGLSLALMFMNSDLFLDAKSSSPAVVT